ncbi:hypothetical protein WKW77_33745 [Variovorax ureilyticus]|uniref:Uncharacterized protein n=1 Tax=Variovorax ureilyticus TaxID=1836198 RepID=A0ABU8VRU3_9BURK
MKIFSINKEGTNSVHDVLFNIDSPIDCDVLCLVNVDGFSVKADGQCLRVRSTWNHVVDEEAVRKVNEALETAKAGMQRKDEEADRDRERMLNLVQANTGLRR